MKLIRPISETLPTAVAANAAVIRRAIGDRNIVMVGLMGCGKTSVGRRLAQLLEIRFVDTDAEIESSHDRTIPEIFEEHGEAYFRNGERRVIKRLLQSGPQVLATGGGAFLSTETRTNIAERGIAVWLKADLPTLMRRVRRRSNRPLLKAADPEAVMAELIKARYPIYGLANVTVTSRDVPHDVVAHDVIAALAAYPGLANTTSAVAGAATSLPTEAHSDDSGHGAPEAPSGDHADQIGDEITTIVNAGKS